MSNNICSHGEIKKPRPQKVGALRAARVKTGNKTIDLPPLTDLDKKVLGLMGYDYVEGTECPDSWPEEQVLKNFDKLFLNSIHLLTCIFRIIILSV